jgi:hypothetical protein
VSSARYLLVGENREFLQSNPATGEWATVPDARCATVFATRGVAEVIAERVSTECSLVLAPVRVGDYGEPLLARFELQ